MMTCLKPLPRQIMRARDAVPALLTGLMAAAFVLLPAGQGDADSRAPQSPCHQYYPNVQGQVLLENEHVIVQRYIFEPGVWEGVHAHPAGGLYIHIKGGHWTVRNGASVGSGWSETGSVGWYGPVNLAADHESVNSGDEPIDLIWVTLKSVCEAGG